MLELCGAGGTRRGLETSWRIAQLLEQRPGVFQVGGVEAFGEPVVDVGEHRARLVAMTLCRGASVRVALQCEVPTTCYSACGKRR
jgi:hypothetical protein